QPVDRFAQQVGTRMLAVPLLVGRERRESEVGAEVDDANATLAQRADRRRGGSVRVGDDRRVELAVGVELQLAEDERHAIARIEVVEAPSDLRAPGYSDELEARVAPQQVRGERAGEDGRA